ncbi:hypothetical protein GCM10009832_20990 [Dietzia kunjamensis subsp. schimae]
MLRVGDDGHRVAVGDQGLRESGGRSNITERARCQYENLHVTPLRTVFANYSNGGAGMHPYCRAGMSGLQR